MNQRALIGAAGFLVVAGLTGGYALVNRASAAPPPPAAEGVRKTELTVYNNDFALVHESRDVRLEKGANSLAFSDVSKELDPRSVLLRGSGPPGSTPPEIIGHSYELGVQDSQALLQQGVGKPVELIRYSETGREAAREKGRLLVAEGGRPAVVEVGDKLLVNPEGTVILDRTEATPAIPQLTVQAASSAAQPAAIDLTYLTRGLSWSADYVATLSAGAEDRLDLECYATVTNRTGVRYPDAAVTLVAGSPNRAVESAKMRVRQNPFLANRDLAGAIKAIPSAQSRAGEPADYFQGAALPEGVGELYAYPLKNAVTVQNEQLNRLLMLRREGMPVKKEYSYRTPDAEPYSSPTQERGVVTAALSFVNTARAGIGAPLPAGAIRVYDPDKSGRLRYAGAADILATPKNRKVGFTLGNAFDVTASYRTVSSRKVGKRLIRKQVEVVLRNERSQPARVRVAQGFYGGWKLVSASLPHGKPDSSTAQWTVPVPAGGKTRLSYTVDLSSY